MDIMKLLRYKLMPIFNPYILVIQVFIRIEGAIDNEMKRK